MKLHAHNLLETLTANAHNPLGTLTALNIGGGRR